MSTTAFTLVFLLMIALMLLGIPIAVAMVLVGAGAGVVVFGTPFLSSTGAMLWGVLNDNLLTAAPLFILLGELLLRSGMADRMYGAMSAWLSRLPGGLLHTNVACCALFAATSGSSVATAATVGTVALPQAKRFGYNERLFLGTLAAGGTLGILIPPSINMIIYAVLTNTSVPKLYLAGIIPGIVLTLMFMVTILLLCFWRPAWGGERVLATWGERIASLAHLIPPLGIFLVVVGSIYAGVATPTEAASLGVVASLGLAQWAGRLNFAMLREAIEGTMRSTAMVMLIVLAAYFLNFVISSIGLTTALTGFIEGLGWSPAAMLLAVVIFYVILGCFMETLSMMITTIPIIAPVMFKLGFDPIWFGIMIILLVETALVTPPVGLNLFVVQNLRKNGSLNDVIVGTLPFVIALFTMLLVLSLFPQLALWLPRAVS